MITNCINNKIFTFPIESNYPDVKFKQGVITAVAGDNDLMIDGEVYTPPVGRVAIMINQPNISNTSGLSSDFYLNLKTGGNYYKFSLNTTVTNNAFSSPTNMTPPMLSNGDSISINSTQAGAIVLISLIEFPQEIKSGSLKKAQILGLSSGDNVLYNCPSGKKALVVSRVSLRTTEVILSQATIFNNSGTSITYSIYQVPSGEPISSKYLLAVVTTSSSTQAPFAVNKLNADDSIIINSSSGAAGQYVSLLIKEFDA